VGDGAGGAGDEGAGYAGAGGAGAGDLTSFYLAAKRLTEPVNAFFDDVLVMAEDLELRKARLGLLARINAVADGVLNWRAL
jgi:glycyl-tRNA synthetase